MELAENRRELSRRIISYRKVGRRSFRRDEETHRQRLYSGAELARALRRVGFRARIVRDYGALRFQRGQVGLVARKP